LLELRHQRPRQRACLHTRILLAHQRVNRIQHLVAQICLLDRPRARCDQQRPEHRYKWRQDQAGSSNYSLIYPFLLADHRYHTAIGTLHGESQGRL
jgi:hypothetical protein